MLGEGLGKSIKDPMKAKFEAGFDDRHDAWCDGTIKAASERRIFICTWLGESWDKFLEEKGQGQVTKAFKPCGMYNALDGSEDNEIHVQGIEN